MVLTEAGLARNVSTVLGKLRAVVEAMPGQVQPAAVVRD